MSAGPAPILLLDAASLYFRAFFGVPDRSGPGQVPTNAVRGFLDMIATLLGATGADGVVACWDEDWRPAFRVEAIPTYKTHRLAAGGDGSAEESPPGLAAQVPIIAEALAAIGIARVGCPGFEADDVIGTLATRFAPGRRVTVVTGDRDLFQLVDDAGRIDVLYTARRGVRDAELVTQDYLARVYGVPTGSAYADLATLRGDTSDGLPGVKGIGEKTAARVLARYGDLDGVRQAAADDDVGLTPALRRHLLAAGDYLDRASGVVRVVRDCPIPGFSADVPREVADLRLLSEIASTHRLATHIDRVLSALDLK